MQASLERVKRNVEFVATMAGLIVILLTGLSYAIYAVARQEATEARVTRISDAILRRDDAMLERSKAQLEIDRLQNEELKQMQRDWTETKADIATLKERTKNL